jgi:multidrug resistance efflux pump
MNALGPTPALEETSEPVNELFLELPPYLARALYYLLLALVLAAGVYAGVGQVDEIVSARAVMVPQGQARKVSAAVAGKVTSVAAEEGDPVAAGQVLVYLEAAAAQEQVEGAVQEAAIREQQLQEALAKKMDGLAIAEARARVADAQEQLAAGRRALAASMVVAPLDGQLIRLGVRGAGETVQPGQVVAEVAPAGAPLVFEAQVANGDIGRVRPGQRARIKVDAYPHHRYGAIAATVAAIAPGATAEAGAGLTYRVVLTPSPSPRRRIPLRLGLAATVEIVARRRRLIELFVDSLRGGN